MCVCLNEEGRNVGLFLFRVKIVAVAFLTTGAGK